MSCLVVYDDAGKITQVITGSDHNLEANAERVTGSCLIVDDAGFDTHYVDLNDSSLKPKGDQPNENYVFDYSSGQWLLDIELARSLAWAQVKQSRDQEEFGEFQWGDYVFQCDEVSQRRIQGAVQLAAIDSSMTLEWTLADNSAQLFTAADYIQIGQALAVHVSQCHERGRMLRQQINESTTEAELEAIVW